MTELCKSDFDCLAGLNDCQDPFPPPKLSTEEYLEFIWENLQRIPPELLEKQRELKDRWKSQMVPFQLK